MITRSNLNLSNTFGTSRKRVCGSPAVHLIWLKIPLSTPKLTMWTLNITAIISFHSQSTKTIRPKTSRSCAAWILTKLCVEALADVSLNLRCFSTVRIEVLNKNHTLVASVVCANVPVNQVIKNKIQYWKCMYHVCICRFHCASASIAVASPCAGGIRGFLSLILKACKLLELQVPAWSNIAAEMNSPVYTTFAT